MPTRVFLLRHAESANPRIFHGAESDIELSERGHRQAEAIADYLRGHQPEVLISSGMRRALQTAEPIRRVCNLPVQVEPLLHERRVGALAGTSNEGTVGVWPSTLKRWMAGETDHAPPGAESFEDIRARVVPVWNRCTEQHAGRTIVIVAHGIVCRVLLLSLIPGRSAADWRSLGPIHNVGVTEWLREGEGPWQTLRIDDRVVTV